jgi:hypothetical protein
MRRTYLNNKEDILRRLKENTVYEGHCWRFSGSHSGGYGEMKIDGRLYKTHQLSLYIFKDFNIQGKDNLQALHVISCPYRDCWNPEHLYIGTHIDNGIDRKFVGRLRPFYPCGHENTEENTVLQNKGNGYTSEVCKKCKYIRTRNWLINKGGDGDVNK